MQSQIAKFSRRPFEVRAVQVTFNNAAEVAKWAKGRVVETPLRLMNTDARIPSVEIDGEGKSHGQVFTALVGDWIVKMRNTFRVYKHKVFINTFDPAVELSDSSMDFLAMFVEAMTNDPAVADKMVRFMANELGVPAPNEIFEALQTDVQIENPFLHLSGDENDGRWSSLAEDVVAGRYAKIINKGIYQGRYGLIVEDEEKFYLNLLAPDAEISDFGDKTKLTGFIYRCTPEELLTHLPKYAGFRVGEWVRVNDHRDPDYMHEGAILEVDNWNASVQLMKGEADGTVVADKTINISVNKLVKL